MKRITTIAGCLAVPAWERCGGSMRVATTHTLGEARGCLNWHLDSMRNGGYPSELCDVDAYRVCAVTEAPDA